MRSRRALGVVVAVVLVALVAFGIAAVALQPAGSSPRSSPASAGTAGHSSAPLRVAAVGDSLSAGTTGILTGRLDDANWERAVSDRGLTFVGGWAHAGATPARMAEGVKPVGDVDVLVVLAGTNQVRHGRTFAEARASYDRIVQVIDAKSVVIGAIPPSTAHGAAAVSYNEKLSAYARERGFRFDDPWSFARAENGSAWKRGLSLDGIHPTLRGYRRLGENLRAAILE